MEYFSKFIILNEPETFTCKHPLRELMNFEMLQAPKYVAVRYYAFIAWFLEVEYKFKRNDILDH